MNYIAEVLGEPLPHSTLKRGRRIGIFRVENEKKEMIGEYERNYLSFFNTFFPFQQNGKDYALYSPDYTATRIMQLPSCRDIGGEEPNSWGFCPVDYFIPTYINQEITSEMTGANGSYEKDVSVRRINNPAETVRSEFNRRNEYTNGITGEQCVNTTNYRPLTALMYYPFGFVAGCLWGDESTYKVQFLDLSQAEKGVLKREEKFGYLELPENQPLKDAIDMNDFGYDDSEEESNYIRINIMQTFDLRSGKAINRY